MDVTKHNFEEQLDDIKKVIEEADFLAIDAEFTGLSLESVPGICPFDTPAERYKKQIDGASDFLLLQFGLCAFKAIKEEERYEVRPYNFYVFPRPINRTQDRRFLCQSSSIDFLVAHDFDFNKVFKEGIPYLTHPEEVRLKEELEQRLSDKSNSSFNSSFHSPSTPAAQNKTSSVPKEHQEFISKVKEKITAYIKSDEKAPLVLPPHNSYQRKLIYQSIKPAFPLINLSTKTGEKKERYLEVTKFADKNDAEEKEIAAQNLERMKLDIHLGFTKIMRAITESGKLVVGHNMYLDVLHTVRHFYQPLPQELEEFKQMMPSVLPRILDTKLMASTSPLKEYFMGTGLEEVKETVRLPPFKTAKVDFPEGFDKYKDGQSSFHEAGYDAFVTGHCFASMLNFLGRYETPAATFLLPSHKRVDAFVNRLFMMRVYDIPFVNLSGPDEEASRDHVFHVTFPKEWRADELRGLFEPFGNIQISWLTKFTAYVGLHNKDNAKRAAAALCKGMGECHVISYKSHKLMTQIQSPSATSTPSPIYATPSGNKSSARCPRKRSPPTDVPYPPTKVPRKSLTKEPLPYPSIPEEDEQIEEDTMSTQEKDTDAQEGDGRRGMTLNMAEGEDRTRDTVSESKHDGQGDCVKAQGKNKKSKEVLEDSACGNSKPEQANSSQNGKVFEEPDSW